MTSSSSNEQHSRVKFSDPLKKPQISPVQNSITLMKTILDNSKLPQSISSFSSSEKTLINTSYNLLKDLFQQATPTPLKYHLTHSITAPSAFSRGKFIKTLLNILSRFYTKIFHYNYGFDIFNNINHVIIRMYIDKLLTLDDIEKIVKFYFIFSCLYSQEKGSCQVGMRNYVIKNYEFIEIAFKLMLNVFVVYNNNNEYSNEEIQVIVSLLQFFEHSFIVDNYANVFYLTNSAYKYRYSVFRLLRLLSKNSYKFQDQIQNDTLYNQCKRLFLSIFKHNFTYAKFMAPILNISKDILVNFNTHSITQFKYNFQRLNFIIQYLHDAYFEECKHYRNDQYAVNTMFYFGKKDAGLALSLGKICRDNINIIFSFKLIPKKLRSKFIILGFTADQHHLMVYLQREVNDDKSQQQQQCVKYKLMFKHNKNEIETSFHIEINKTYIFLLTLGNKQIKIQNNQSEFTFETKFNASDKLQINVGYFHKEDPTQSYTFNGCIGTIIGITKLSEDHIAQIFKLKGQYESILYDSNYINDNDISVNKTYHSNEAISKSFIETKHVAFIISPKTFQLKKPTDFYNKIKRMNMGIACSRSQSKTALPPEQKCVSLEQSNYLGLDSSMMCGQSIEMLSNIDQKFHVIQMKKTFNEFLKCDGLKFITMIFEYYYQIIVLYETQRYDDIYEILNIMENNLDFLFLFLYTFLDEINHDIYINEVKQIFYVMAHVITKFIAIGGDVGKIFYNVELIMIIYMNKIANDLVPNYLELTRCFCDVLLNTSFYIQSNLYRVDGFFDCLRNTITHSHEFITKGLLDKMFNLSEYIFPHQHTKPSLITSYCGMLSHFIGNSKSFNVNETSNSGSNCNSSSSGSNYVNYFFDVLLKHMKKIGYDETAKCGDTNDMIMSIEDDNNNNIEILQLCNDNMEINDISLHKHYNTYLTIFHYIKTLHVYNLIPLLNNTNQHHLLIAFLDFFSNHLQKQKSNNIIQQIAKLILLIMVDYLVKPNTHINKNINNDTLHNKIKNLSFSPLVIETLISAVISTKTFEDKLNFNMKDMNIVFNTRDISYKQIILLFQVVYTIMFQNVKELLQQRGECVLIDYIETYYVLYKCFESVLNINDNANSFYNEFFTETQCFMEQTYTKYFSLFIEDEDTFEQCSLYQIDKSKFNITTYNEFKSQLIQNFIHISQRLILGHMNPFIYKAMISRSKDETIHCILDIIIHLMEFFIDNASSSSSFELKKFYISNLISFYARLNYALCCCQSDIMVKFIYKRHVKLFCKFLNIFKETYLLYSLIGINIGNARLMLISEIVFDNYVNMYLINTQHEEDEHTRKFICDEFPKMVFNIKQPITQSNNEDNVVNYLTTICYYVDHQSKNKEIHSSLTEIHELLVERKFTMLTGVNISILFVIKSLLYIHSLHSTSTNSDISCSSLIDKLEKFSSLLIKELIDNQSIKIPNTKDPFYNRFIDVIKTKTKKQNTKQPIDIYNQLLDICKSQYQGYGDELLTYNAFDVNNTTNKRTPGRKYTKTQINALSPQQKPNLNLSADVNKHKKMKMSTTSLTTFRTESSSRDEGKGRTTSLIFDNNDYGVNSSNDGSDYQLVQDDSKDNKYGGWFSKKANSNNSNNSNSNSNSKKKRRDNRSTTTMGLKNNFLSRKFLIENSNNVKDNKRVIDNIYDEQSFKEINNTFSLLNPKRQLLLSHFALEFKNIYFYNESFIKMKHAYFKYTNLPQIRKNTKQLNYPSKIKNFSNTIEPPLFLTYNKHFFNGKYFAVSHQYINNTHKRSNINENKIPFQQRHFPINNNISRYEYKCELITTEYSLYGVITICKDFIIFQSNINDPRLHKNPEERLKYVFSSAKGDRVIKQRMKCIFYNDINEMLIRRYLFLWQSIEIFTKDGKSCYFNFFNESNCNEFIKTLPKDSIKAGNAFVVLLLDKKELYMEMERYSKKWNDNELSTYEYLLYINKYASRSYKEVNQYPIMPWLLNNYNSIFDFNVGMITKKDGKDNKTKAMNNKYTFDIEQHNVNASVNTVDASLFKNNFRDLNYPISVQTHDKRNAAISRYRESKEEKKFAYHLGSFYSTSSFIFYYLMRMQPFMDCLIRLQNGVQENTNRMFYSIADTQEVLENSTDNRELIPEFYACIECFLNLNCSFFGYKTKKKLVDDIEFNDKRLSTYVQFIIANRKLLNTFKVSQSVIKWIDYTFGVNQFALKEQNCTVFQKSSYAQKVNFVNKMQSIKKKNQIKNNGVINYEDVFRKITDKILVVMNFGQAPFQIFNSALSQRKENGNEKFAESKLFGGNNDGDNGNDSDNDMSDNENGEGQNDILMMLSYLKEKNTIQRELVIKTKNENICGCYIENSINSNNNRRDTVYSLASNGQLLINYDIITNQKIKNAMDIKLPGFTLKNRTNINRMIKSNESINYPEYSFCIMNKQKFIITVGYLSNAFQLYDISDKDKKYKFYIMEDFVRSICKTSEHVFLIGLNNGRLLEYEIQYKHNDTTFMSHECKCKRFIYAHSSSICVIEYIPRLNIIITVGDDNYIYIRKYFNFELLSYISLDSKYKVLSLKVSDVNCVYVLVYDKTQSASTNKMKVIGYTLTGIEFAESEYGMYTNMEITTSNNVILGIDETATQSKSNDKKKMNHIMLLKGCSLERIGYMRLTSCEKKSIVYMKYYAKKKMLFYYFKDDIRVSQLEDGEKEIMVF